MATSRTSDINLVIRARDESTRAVDLITGALNRMFSGQEKVTTSAAGLAAGLAAVDKAVASTAAAQEKLATSATRHAQAVHAANAGIREQQERVATLQRGLSILATEADKAFIGPKRDGLTTLLRTAKTELADAERQLGGFQRTLDRSLGGLQGSRNGLLELGRSTAAMGAAQAEAKGQVDALTASLQRQQDAVRDNAVAEQRRSANSAAAQSFFNNKFSPSVATGPATANGATYDALIDQFQRLDAEARKVKEQLDPLGAAIERNAQSMARIKELRQGGFLTDEQATAQETRLAEALARTRAELDGTAAAEKKRIDEADRAAAAASREAEAQQRLNEADARRVRSQVNPVGALGEQHLADLVRLQQLQDAGAISASERAQREAQLTQEYARQRAELDGTARAAREAAEADKRLDAAARDLRQELNPLGALQERFNQKLREAIELEARGKISADELRERTHQLNQELARARQDLTRQGNTGIGLFGLRPYELTNLGYQVNDVVTQLASGTSLTQTFAQQSGQILQLFPRVTGAIVSALTNPMIIAAATAAGSFLASLKEAANEAGRLREYEGVLTANANGALYQAQAMEEVTDSLRRYGVATADAVASMKTFVAEGVAPDRLEQFGRTALDMSDVMGIKVPEAAKQLATAFTGGYDAIVKLDEATNFLTASEREHIRSLFEEGQAGRARAEALAIFTRQQDEAAGKARGPWTEAARSLGGAWQDFIELLRDNSFVDSLAKDLDNLAKSASSVVHAISGATSAQDLRNDIQAQYDKIASLNQGINRGLDPLGVAQREVEWRTGRVKELMAQLQRLERQTGERTDADGNAVRADDNGTDPRASGQNNRISKAAQDKVQEINLEDELQRLRRRGEEGLSRAEQARRIQLAGDLAFNREILATGEQSVAQRQREIAAARERSTVEREAERARKQAITERERAISQFNSRVVGAEGGTAQNPFSTAKGFGQFTERTWLDQFRKVFADQSDKLSRDQILALRNNQGVAKAIIDNYARENARFLESFGAKVTAGNLYLSHFLGARGARAVLTANSATPVDQILRRQPNADQVLNGNRGYLFDKQAGRYRTAGELQAFIGNRVGDVGVAQSQGQAAIKQLEQASVQRQENLNLAIKQGNDERQRSIEALTAEALLLDTALIAAQRKAAVDEAEATLRKRLEDANKNLKPGEVPATITDEDVRRTRELAAAEFDLRNARNSASARTNETMRPVDDLTQERDAVRARIGFLREQGDNEAADGLTGYLDQVNAQLRDAITNAIAFYEALDPETDPLGRTREQIEATVLGLRTARDQSTEWGTVLNINAQQIAQAFGGTMTRGMDRFAKAVGEGNASFKEAKDAFLDFAGSFLQTIVQMIQQQIAFNIAKSILSGFGVSVPGVPVPTNHTGGIAGVHRTETRTVSPEWFSNAMRYHTGGIAGLRPNEVPAILEAGEEVLTRSDPRHRANGGGQGGGSNVPFTLINVDNPEAAMEQALQRPGGERVMFNFFRDNAEKFRGLLGS